jgi:DNA-binding transcriptional ArsR family regulator
MSTNPSAQILAQQIEELVQNFIAESRRAAAAAVNRAFVSVASKPVSVQTRQDASRKYTRGPTPRRRAPDELNDLRERLYDVLCEKPGESMCVLAELVGATPRELKSPIARLKKDGQVHSIREPQGTRYFPKVKMATKAG